MSKQFEELTALLCVVNNLQYIQLRILHTQLRLHAVHTEIVILLPEGISRNTTIYDTHGDFRHQEKW